MRTEVLDKLRRIEAMRLRVQQVDEALEALEPSGRLMLAILMDGERETGLRIAHALGVSKATAYRYIDELLQEIDNILEEIA